MIRNKYLQILELEPGVSKKEIKTAYRRLSKKYHPDVNKEAGAKEQFIRIHEAYKFLTDVGAHPGQQATTSAAYDYDAHDRAFDEWRRRARQYARRRAAEAERERNLLIKEILTYFNYAAVVMAFFDLLLAVDFLLPYQTREDEILAMKESHKIYDRTYGDKAEAFRYLDIKLNTNQIRLKADALPYFNDSDPVMITSTSILNKPVSVDTIAGDTRYTFTQAYGIYTGFGFLIPIVLISLLFYGVIVKNQENRFSLAIVLSVLFLVQLYIFISV